MDKFFKQIKDKYHQGSMLIKLIFINIGVFFVIKILSIFATLFKLDVVDIINIFALPSKPSMIVNQLWSIITYMFVHESFWHIFWNMLWIYWFGKIFLNYFTGKNLASLYVLGGLAGGLLYILSFNFIPYYIDMNNRWLIGASASVLAIVMASAFYRPEVNIHLLFFGSIRIVYIALGIFILDFFSLDDIANPGGHVAHIGGALIGYLFAVQYKKGKDITGFISKSIDRIFSIFKKRNNPKLKVRSQNFNNYKKGPTTTNNDDVIDSILDKLKKSGYGSLTSEEKRHLFDASKK